MDYLSALLIAIILFVYEFLASADAYGPKLVFGILPLTSGFFTGILLGDPVSGAIVGAATQLIALGAVPMGGAVPPEFSMVAIVATVLTIVGGIDPRIAIVLALPAGIIGMYFDILGRTANISLVHRVHSLIEAGRIDEIDKWHILGLGIVGVFRGLAVLITVFIAAYLGGETLKSFLESLPPWILNGLTVAGAVLPALGLGLLLTFLGVSRYIKIFAIAFILTAALSIPYTFAFVLIIGFIAIWFKYRKKIGLKAEGEETKELLPKNVIRSARLRSVFLFEASWNYEIMQGMGYLFSILPVLRYLYKGDELKEAAKSHLKFFNTNPIIGTLVVGLDAAMESSRKGDFDLITKLKTGLMGPLAGFGDSVIYLAVGGVLILLSCTLVSQGVFYSPLIFIVGFTVITLILRFKSFDFGYKRGISLVSVFSEEKMGAVREFAEKLAVLSVGAIIPVVFQVRPSLGAETLSAIDAALGIISISLLISALLGLALTLLAQFMYQKGLRIFHVFITIFIIGFVLGALGIFSVIGYVTIS